MVMGDWRLIGSDREGSTALFEDDEDLRFDHTTSRLSETKLCGEGRSFLMIWGVFAA
jgi:hypothetical protein